ncbi:hypothetical protein Pmgp_01726 [Pelotomaculum propionicicum]|uniref:Uncharacterized protein n=1 Tax=Pelotomaculum propionicicum TaxID=258475 RepID=A0A4Y7RR66_9FIRM|nr:hypothetical protein Pmgp_01726 [Pelotomaculum propionicicum]
MILLFMWLVGISKFLKSDKFKNLIRKIEK